MAITHGDATRNAMCNTVVDLIDAGSSNPNGVLRIIDSSNGTPYAGGNTTAAGTDDATPVAGAGTWSEYIAELAFSNPAFKDAGAPDDPVSPTVGGRVGTAIANDVTEDDNCNAGTADLFEIVDCDENLILTGTITVQSDSSGDILLTSTGIADGDTIAIRNLSYTCAN